MDKRDVAQRMISESAPAKINLYLHIVGRREDEFHLINSLVVFANVADELIVTPAKEFKLGIGGVFGNRLGESTNNLVLRAAALLREAFEIDHGAHIHLTKNIPVGAGLGGGSSDAAATLRALIRLWDIRPQDERVIIVARELGADVPTCFWQFPAVVSGIGQDIRPVSQLPAMDLVLVNPGTELLTKDVYDKFVKSDVEEVEGMIPNVLYSGIDEMARSLHHSRNDLTDVATTFIPQIQKILTYLSSLPGALLVRMTGSGPTCFALFADVDAASRAAACCQMHESGWWVAKAKISAQRKHEVP